MENPSLQNVLGLPLSAWVRVVSGTGLIEHHLDGAWVATGSRVNPATGELERWDDGAYEATGWLYVENEECLRQAGSLSVPQPTEIARGTHDGLVEKKSSITDGPGLMTEGTGTRAPVAQRIGLPSDPRKEDLWKREGPKAWSHFSEWLAIPHHRFLIAGWGILAFSLAGYLQTEPGSLWHKAAFWMCVTLLLPVVLALRKRSGLHAAALVFATFAICRLFSWQHVWSSLKPSHDSVASHAVAEAREPGTQQATGTPPANGGSPLSSDRTQTPLLVPKPPLQQAKRPPTGLKVVTVKNEKKSEYDHWVEDATGTRSFLTSAASEAVPLVSPGGQFIALSFSEETAEGEIRFYRWRNELSFERHFTELDEVEKVRAYFAGLAELPSGERFVSHRFRAAAWESDTRLRFDASLGTSKAVYGSFCISKDEVYTPWRPSLELSGGGAGIITPPNEKLEISMNVMPVPEAMKNGNDGMNSRRNFLIQHHQNAARSLNAFMAGYADEVLVSNSSKVEIKTNEKLRQEEAQDRARYASIEETIVKGATMEPLAQGDRPRVEYDLQINNTLNDSARTPYRAIARIEVQLAPVGESWRIVARRTKRFSLQREGEPGPGLGDLRPMDGDAGDSSNSSAQQTADSEVLEMQRFLKEHHLNASLDLETYMGGYDGEILIVNPQKKVTKTRAELTQEEWKDRQRFVAVREAIISDIKIVERAEGIMIVSYMLRIDNIKADAARTSYQADVKIVSRIRFTADGPKINARYTSGGQPNLTGAGKQPSPASPVLSRPSSPSRSGDWRNAAEDFEKR